MQPSVPPPSRPAGAEEQGPAYERREDPAAGSDASLPVSAPANVDAGAGPSKSSSETDLTIFGQKMHVHGALARSSMGHPPQHHNPHAQVNYAAAAREVMHEVHKSPPAVNLMRKSTGVEEWDKVNTPRGHPTADSLKELLVPGAHRQGPMSPGEPRQGHTTGPWA